VAYSPDGKRLACGSATFDSTKRVYGAGEVKVWDVQTGRELLVLKGHTGFLSVAYSPDGKRLASAAQTSGPAAVVGEVKVWDAETGQEVFTVEAPANYQQTVAYSPDGKRLIHVGVCDYHGKSSNMTVWDAQTGRELLTQKTHGQVARVAFSPDGKRLVTGAGNWFVSAIGALIDRAVRTRRRARNHPSRGTRRGQQRRSAPGAGWPRPAGTGLSKSGMRRPCTPALSTAWPSARTGSTWPALSGTR
jgi:WD40 repeat protein